MKIRRRLRTAFMSKSSGVTLRDIAKEVGVCHATVSRALQNAPNISLARRKQIQEVALRMGYRPNAMAKALGFQRRQSGKGTVGAEIAWINFWTKPEMLRKFHEFDLYWTGAYTAAEELGYRLEEFIYDERMSAARLEEILLARNIRGILIPPKYQNFPTDWNKFAWEKFSIVRFGYSVSYPPVHLTTSNHLTSGMLAVDNMVRLGYRRIGFACKSLGSAARFQAGYLMRQVSLKKDAATIPIFSPEASKKEDPSAKLASFSAWIKKHRPDSILTDIVELKEMLEELNYSVPSDIGLATTSISDGHSDAGIYQNSEEIGKAAAQTVIAMLNHNDLGIPQVVREILITGRWVDGSCLPAKRGKAQESLET